MRRKTLASGAQQLVDVLKPNPHTVTTVANGTGKSRPTVYRWLAGYAVPDAADAEWLKKHLGITGSWTK